MEGDEINTVLFLPVSNINIIVISMFLLLCYFQTTKWMVELEFRRGSLRNQFHSVVYIVTLILLQLGYFFPDYSRARKSIRWNGGMEKSISLHPPYCNINIVRTRVFPPFGCFRLYRMYSQTEEIVMRIRYFIFLITPDFLASFLYRLPIILQKLKYDS